MYFWIPWIKEYCFCHCRNILGRASYYARYNKLGSLSEEQIVTNGIIETRQYIGKAGTVGRIKNADGSIQYYEISDCTNFAWTTVDYNPSSFSVEILGKKPEKSLFYTYPF